MKRQRQQIIDFPLQEKRKTIERINQIRHNDATIQHLTRTKVYMDNFNTVLYSSIFV